jgi:hypothetical protein
MSSPEKVVSAFEKIGARATIQPMTRQLFQRHGTPFVIDVRRRGDGEAFEILKTKNVKLQVLDSMAIRRQYSDDVVNVAESAERLARFASGRKK